MDRSQIIFLSFAALVIVYQVIMGWRLGLVRQSVRLGALVAGYLVAFWCSRAAVPFLRPLGYPDVVLQCLGGLGMGLVVYLAICITGGILFKRTVHQSVGLVWFIYGITGALLGLAFGLFFTLAGADAIRLLGSLAGASTPHPQAPSKSPESKGDARHPSQTPMAKLSSPPPESTLLLALVEMKKSLERGTPGEILQTLDPVPKKVYAVSSKMGRVVCDVQDMERFFNYPGARELAVLPEIQALREDPDILRSLRDHHYLPLLKNEKIVKAANDPQVGALLKGFDLEKALDYALKKEEHAAPRNGSR